MIINNMIHVDTDDIITCEECHSPVLRRYITITLATKLRQTEAVIFVREDDLHKLIPLRNFLNSLNLKEDN